MEKKFIKLCEIRLKKRNDVFKNHFEREDPILSIVRRDRD